MSKMQSQVKSLKKHKLPKGWREDSNAVPLPFSRPSAEFKGSKEAEIVQGLNEIIEAVGLEYLVEHLESVCDEQAGLYKRGCEPVFPKDRHLCGIWSSFAKDFRDVCAFTRAYQPTKYVVHLMDAAGMPICGADAWVDGDKFGPATVSCVNCLVRRAR